MLSEIKSYLTCFDWQLIVPDFSPQPAQARAVFPLAQMSRAASITPHPHTNLYPGGANLRLSRGRGSHTVIGGWRSETESTTISFAAGSHCTCHCFRHVLATQVNETSRERGGGAKRIETGRGRTTTEPVAGYLGRYSVCRGAAAV